jgi:molybdopterin synthase catalytic subunit
MFVLSAEPLDVAELRSRIEDPGHGAVLIFEGVARDNFEGRSVEGLHYEAYPQLCEPVMDRIEAELLERWPRARLVVAHRTGRLAIGEVSLVIAVGTPHRGACYEASRFVIEAIKERLPVWKKELYADGQAWKANAGPEAG